MKLDPVQQLLHRPTSKPPPIGGLNKRDSLVGMPPTDAVRLSNWIPDAAGVKCRKGFREWAINIPGGLPVTSLLTWFGPDVIIPSGPAFLNNPTTVPGKFFCATDDGIYDITDATTTPPLAQVLSGLDNAGRIHQTMLTNSAGAFLLCASEADGYLHYDGTTWTLPIMGTDPGEIDGVDPADLVHVNIWKRRAWFVERDSTNVWYLDVDAIAGPATKFDLGPNFRHGGHLAYTVNWTIDAGEGIDDLIAFVSSNGDVVIYKGTDPDSADTFGLQGAYHVGEIPKGRRGYCQLAGDTLILSVNGIYPISYITRGGSTVYQAGQDQNYINKIRTDFVDKIASSFNEYGWDLFVHAKDSLLLCNTPNFSTRNTDRQYCMKIPLNAWTELNSIPVQCYGSSSGFLFSGTDDGRVLILFQGFFDNVPYGESVGDGIVGYIQPAFDYYGAPGQNKIVHMLRPNFLAVAVPSWNVLMNVDFVSRPAPGLPVSSLVGESLWDIAVWDSNLWGGSIQKFGDWIECGAIGFAFSPAFTIVCVADTTLVSIDYISEAGGPL